MQYGNNACYMYNVCLSDEILKTSTILIIVYTSKKNNNNGEFVYCIQ